MSRRGPIIAGAVSLVLAVLAVVLLLLPKMNDVKSTKNELSQAQTQEQTLRAQLASLQEAQKNAPLTKKQIAKIQTQIPPTADLPGLIRLLNDAADRSAVDFFSVAPGTPTASTSGFSIIPTAIQVDGSYFSLEEFLFRLETLPRAGKVTNITIAPGAEAAGTTTATTSLSMQLTVEFYTSDTSAGPGSQPGPTGGTTSGGTSGSGGSSTSSPAA
jgi:Tfp pilus assembly protein PilO